MSSVSRGVAEGRSRWASGADGVEESRSGSRSGAVAVAVAVGQGPGMAFQPPTHPPAHSIRSWGIDIYHIYNFDKHPPLPSLPPIVYIYIFTHAIYIIYASAIAAVFYRSRPDATSEWARQEPVSALKERSPEARRQ